MLLQYGALGVTMSWDDGFPGARASRPHQARHSLGHLPHLDQPGTTPCLSFGLADAVPAHRVAACGIAVELSGGQRDRMRAGRPRSQGMPSRRHGGGVSGGRLLRKPTCTLWETPVYPRAVPPPCRADHSRKNSRSLMKTNHQWTRINTRTDRPPSTTTGAKMLLHFCPVGVTLSWEEAHPGARASRPHKSSRSFGHLLHRNQPAAAPCPCFGRAHAVPAGRAVGCNIAGKLSGNRRDSMRAGRPRSRGGRPDGEVGGIRRATSLKAGLSPLGNSRLPASRAPAPRDWADPSRRTIN